jgi:serine/threonine-protein kinase
MSEPIERLRAALAGRYAIEQEAGHGGMAVVYRARDLRHARTVAIKVFRGDVVGRDDAVERFLQEIRIVARLAHPHVLPLHDSGEIEPQGGEPGLLYYVMPFVGGPSLRDRLRSEVRLPVDEALEIATTVASALDHAHRHDVLHRDVKPENILLQEGEAVVADFGVARAIQGAGGDTRTLPGLAIGTPAYMSPEQATGDEQVDGRSDQYALACVVFEMLAGKPPYAGASVRATMAQHLQAPVPSLRAERPEVPTTIERAVQRALSKDPGQRFASVAEFAAALAARTDAELPAFDAPASRSIAVLPFVNASSDPDNEYFSDGMTDELIHLLAQVEGLRVAPRTSVFALAGQRLDVRAVGARLGVVTVLEGSVRKAGGRLRITAQLSDAESGRLLWSERFDRDDRDVFAIQEDLARTIVATLRADLLGTLGDPVPRRYTRNLTAYNLYLRGRHCWNKRTQAGIAEAIAYFERAIAEDPSYALAYTGLADAYALQLDYRAAPVADGMRRAREMARKALELDDTLAEAHTSLAWVIFIHDWDWEAAEREFRRAIDLNPRYPTARQWHSWYLAAMGRSEEALAEGRRAVALDPASISIQRGMGWLLYYARHPARAEVELERALVMDPNQTETHLILALARSSAGDLDGADAALDEALGLAPDDSGSLAARARVAMQRGRVDEARAVETQLVELERRRYVSPSDFAKLYVALGDFDRAFAAIERAYAERRGWLAYLGIEPLLDPLRADPRFQVLLERMALPAR